MDTKIKSKSWPRVIGFGLLGVFLGGVVGIGVIAIPALLIHTLDQLALLIFLTTPAGIITGAFIGIAYGARGESVPRSQ